MILVTRWVGGWRVCAPRVSGDDPVAEDGVTYDPGCSPRERG